MMLDWLKGLLTAPAVGRPGSAALGAERPRFDPVAAGERFYVYVHMDMHGSVFYVGKGKGRRAWVYGRDPLWNQYVSETLKGRYQVRIVASDLSESDAIDREDDLMREYGDQLINRQNMGRTLDFEALSRRDELISRMRHLAASAVAEPSAELRLAKLREALAIHYEAATIRIEGGLVGDVMASQPGYGNAGLITQVVDALLESAMPVEAKTTLDLYLDTHPQHRTHKQIEALGRAVDAGKARRKKAEADFVPPMVLPGDWERAEEGGLPVIRLIRARERVDGSLETKLQRIEDMRNGGEPAEALARLKDYIVDDEGVVPRGKEVWMWPHHAAVRLCFKLKLPLEECLFLQRLVHHYRDDPLRLPELQLRLRKRSATILRGSS